jgi:hypothetical protein
MKKMAENMDWENEAPNLAKLDKSNPFKVPSNYFDELEERVHAAIFIEELAKQKSSGFKVPASYFDNLTFDINRQVNINKYNSTKQQGFVTPDGYFENLQQKIAEKTGAKKSIKLWHQPLFKYAVAASLVLVSTTGWFANKTYQEKQTRKVELVSEQMLYNIDEEVILEYLREDYSAKNIPTSHEMESYILDNFSTADLSNNF